MLALPDLFSSHGRTALVTGGATGIGRMCAEALLRAGARVLIASRKAEVCEAAAKELSSFGPCEGFGGSLSSEAGVRELSAEVMKRTDRLDILINNAGISWGRSFESFEWKGWDRVLTTNVTALFTLTRDLMPLLLAAAKPDRPANVINLGSVMGTVTQSEGAYSYSASKAAVQHLTRILAVEFAGRHVTFNTVAPGPFPSKMTEFSMGTAAGAAQAAAAVPAGRVGTPDDVAGVVLFLTGRGGAYTTGSVIPIDGGFSVYAPPPLFESPA